MSFPVRRTKLDRLLGRPPVADRPAPHVLNQWLHRFYVRCRDIRDKRNQALLGLSTFPVDWNRHVVSAAKPPQTVPRTLWMLWLQGKDEAPPLVRASVTSWRALNPTWEVTVLDQESMHDYVDLPDFPGHVKPNHIANIVRLQLLNRYGGVWTDATTLCLRPLDEWLEYATPTGFFAFAKPQPIRALANWFIAAEEQSPFVSAWLRWSRMYITCERKPASYFWQHHTFDWLLRRNWALREAWGDTPHISARGPHILQRVLDGHLDTDSDPSSDQMKMLPLVKLNWKKGYTLSGIDAALERRGVTLDAVK
jgi:hypothetical protein